MITFWNRRELIITQSLDRQIEIRSVLAAHNIDYRIKTRFLNPFFSISNARRSETAGPSTHDAYQYVFYVRKQDYETAVHWVGQDRNL